MGLSCEVVLAGRSSRRSTRPIFETQPGLLRLKVVPTAFQHHLAGDCGVWHGKKAIAQIFAFRNPSMAKKQLPF